MPIGEGGEDGAMLGSARAKQSRGDAEQWTAKAEQSKARRSVAAHSKGKAERVNDVDEARSRGEAR